MKEKPVNENRVLAHMQKNDGERLVMTDSTFRGHRFLDVRISFCDKEGEYHPTRKGLSLNKAQWEALLPGIQAALSEMESTEAAN